MPGFRTRWGLTKSLLWFAFLSTVIWYAAAVFGNQEFVNDGARLTKQYLEMMADLPYLPNSWVEEIHEWRRDIPSQIEVKYYNDEDGLFLVWKIWMGTAVGIYLLSTLLILPFFGWARGGGESSSHAAAPASGGTSSAGGGGGNTYNRPATNEFDVEAIKAKVRGAIVLFYAIVVAGLFLGGWFFYPKFHSLWKYPSERDDIGFSFGGWDSTTSGVGAIMLLAIGLSVPYFISTKVARRVQVHSGGAWTGHHTFLMAGTFFMVLFIEAYVFGSAGLL